MVDPLRPLPVRELEDLEQGRHWTFEQRLPQLDTLTPVRGELRARHLGTVLELEGEAETIVTLCCDRCLQHFNQPLGFRLKELLWLGESAAFEAAVDDPSSPLGAAGRGGGGRGGEEVPVDCLDPRGSFDPEQWVYEQLCLQLSPVNRCGPHCPGPAAADRSAVAAAAEPDAPADPRWEVLRALARPDREP